jgi:hypothetical protein
MTTSDSIKSDPAPSDLKEFGYRALGAAFLASGLALIGLGLASAQAHAAPAPAPRGSVCSDVYGMTTWCDSDY